MGCVYEAEHTGTGRKVAVKVIEQGLRATSQVAIERFYREARAAGAIDTQHITQVIDVGTDAKAGVPYMAMEFLQGMDLRQMIDRLGPIEPQLALRIVAQASLGLQKAHDAQVIHRDIKPANIFLAKREGDEYVVKLLDFGIAKINVDTSGPSDLQDHLTKTGSILGTPNYMSPEQLRGMKIIDHRTDLWSLGVVLYQMLAGRTPFQEIEAFGELMIAVCCESPPPIEHFAPWVKPDIANIVNRALQRSMNDRFASASDFLDAVRPHISNGFAITSRDLVPMSPQAKKQGAADTSIENANTFMTGIDEGAKPAGPETSHEASLTEKRPPTRNELTATIMGMRDAPRTLSSPREITGQTAAKTTASQLGKIERVGTGESFLLRSHLLFGRSAACDMRINEGRVSGEHARLRWTGSTWEIRDLGSKNGTFVGGQRLNAGDCATLLVGDTIGLGGAGSPAPMFVMTNASAPVVSARSARTNEFRFAADGMLTLPDDDYPLVTVVEGREGKWIVEEGDLVRDAEDGESLILGDETWILDVPGVAISTVAVESLVLTLETITLRFSIASKEQDVALTIIGPGKEIHVSPEKQHLLLLELARVRQLSTSGPSEERGWLDRSELCRTLGIDEQRFNVAVHQLRKQFAALGIQGAANIIERKAGTKWIRLGVEKVEVIRAS